MKLSENMRARVRIIVSVLIAAITVPAILCATAENVYAKKWGIIGYNSDFMPIFGWVNDDDEPSEPDPYAAHYDENGKWISRETAISNANNRIGAIYTKDGKPVPNVGLGKTIQGDAAIASFQAKMPAGYKPAFTFTITENGIASYSLKDGELTFFIPWECQKDGRQFKLLGLDKNGNVVEFDDSDKSAYSFTTKLNIEGFAFMVVVKD